MYEGAWIEMTELLKCGKPFSHILTIPWKNHDQKKWFSHISTKLSFSKLNINLKGGLMTYSLRSYYEKQPPCRPLFPNFTSWRFLFKISGGDQSESLAVFIGICTE
jgi:hypothetical protein